MEYQFGPYELDTDRVELIGPHGVVDIEPQVFALLVLLIENADRVVAKDEIIAKVWGDRIVSDASLNNRINALRRAVGDDGKAQVVVKTYPRRGFRFVADLVGTRMALRSSSKFHLRPSIVVLPFRSLSEDTRIAHLSDGLTEDVVLELSRTMQFTVLNRLLSSSASRSGQDSKNFGRIIEASYLVEGSVRLVADRIRVTAQLSDASSGSVVWSDQQDGSLQDIQTNLGSVAQHIVGAIETIIKRMERNDAATGSHEPQAWDYYLKGYGQLFDQGRIGDPQLARTALENFHSALRVDPQLGHAHAGIAVALWHIYGFDFEAEWHRPMANALKHAKLAAELEPDNAEVMATLGCILLHRKQTSDGVAILRHAVDLNPSDVHTRLYFGIGLVSAGNTFEAVKALDICLQIGRQFVQHGAASSWIALARIFEGRFTEAEPVARTAVANPHTQFWANVSLILALVGQGKLPEAEIQCAALQENKPGITCSGINEVSPITKSEHVELIAEGLTKAGLPSR